MFKIAASLSVVMMLLSCSTPPLIWNDDAKSQQDLRTLRLRNRPSVALTRGVTLYADSFHFSDRRHRTGEALGQVFLDVTPDARNNWLMRYGYAGKASFDLKKRTLILSDMPMMEWRMMTQIASSKATEIQVQWTNVDTNIEVKGPTRSDFSKSHAPVANVTPVTASRPPTAIKPFTAGQNKRNP